MSINEKGQFVIKDVTNQRFGQLVALNRIQDTNGVWYWRCKCDCGNETKVRISHLTSDRKTKSCGCLKKINDQNKTHGLRLHPLYEVWRAIKYRCLNVNAHNYYQYGGRGIKICDKWKNDFKSFYDDMVDGYKKGETIIDRINVNGDYCPENCRWVNIIESANNKTTSKYLTMNGIVRTAAEWGRYLGIRPDTIRRRIEAGYPDHLCLSLLPLPTRIKNVQNKTTERGNAA